MNFFLTAVDVFFFSFAVEIFFSGDDHHATLEAPFKAPSDIQLDKKKLVEHMIEREQTRLLTGHMICPCI